MKVFLAETIRLEYANNELFRQPCKTLGILTGDSLEDVVEKYGLEFVDADFDPLATKLFIPRNSSINFMEAYGAMMLGRMRFCYTIELNELTPANIADFDAYINEKSKG